MISFAGISVSLKTVRKEFYLRIEPCLQTVKLLLPCVLDFGYGIHR